MKTKRFSALLCAAVMLVSLLTPTMAADREEKVIDLGDGFYVVETITTYPSTRAGNTASGDKKATLYQGSTLIGTATLYAIFDISGSTAKVVDKEITGTGSNGWSYSRGSTRSSGNTAYGTAYFSNGSTEKRLDISLSCSPSGSLS